MTNPEIKCRVCGFLGRGKNLTNHIRKEHGLKSEDYTEAYIHGGNRPSCESCGGPTRYVAFQFKRFCKGCTKHASVAGGRQGGLAPAWNQGLTKETDERLVAQSKRLSGEGNPFWGKRHTAESRQRISLGKTLGRPDVLNRIQGRFAEFELLTPMEEYYSRQEQHLNFKCKKCGGVNKKTLQTFERGSQCQFCFPIGVSKGEKEISEWLKEMGLEVRTSDRTVLSPKEIDVFLPSYNLGIEFNGLYWHSELSPRGIDRRDHLTKTEAAIEHGMQLFHVFSDEWEKKRVIVQSMILHRIGMTPTRLGARELKVITPDTVSRRDFFINNHISGDVPASIAFALEDCLGIVCCLSLRRPRQKRWGQHMEIARFSTRVMTHVSGGLNRLVRRAIRYAKQEGYEGIVTYADRRFSVGNGYCRTGFELVGNTGLDYWYTDGRVRVDRFSVRAKGNLTERARAQRLGLGRVWGCGSNIWIREVA